MTQAQAFIIWCIDPRIQTSFREWLLSIGLKDKYDPFTCAGAALNLVRPDNEQIRDFIFNQIQIGLEHHGISQVYLVNHLDCAAYGGSKTFPSQDTERKRHIDDLRQARKIVKARFPKLEVLLFLARKEGNREFNWSFEQIP